MDCVLLAVHMPQRCLMWRSSPTELVCQLTMDYVQTIDIGPGNIYLGGPPLVKAATGEVVTGEELGGAIVLSLLV